MSDQVMDEQKKEVPPTLPQTSRSAAAQLVDCLTAILICASVALLWSGDSTGAMIGGIAAVVTVMLSLGARVWTGVET
jgi:hypothetical protein